ncbi:MAG: hypothetical protein ABI297_02795 [Ginsengibacter sp.]
MKQFFLQAKNDFNSFKNTPEIYANKVKAISNSFCLRKPLHLHASELPDYWGGNLLLKQDKIALIEMNPGYDSQKIAFERRFSLSDWDSYSDFHHNIFRYYKNECPLPHHFYHYLASGLANKTFKNNNYLDFLHETVVRFDILPYTSVNFNKARFSESAENCLYTRFKLELLPMLIKEPRIKKSIIHNKVLTKIFIKKGFINEDDMIYVRMNKGKNFDFIYKKIYKGLEIFIFSRSIPYGGFMNSEVYNNVFG